MIQQRLTRISSFQHTAARRRLPLERFIRVRHISVSTHSRPKAAADRPYSNSNGFKVSTHSRPKAAAFLLTLVFFLGYSFNTQPPEGGCVSPLLPMLGKASFNTQPPEGGCSIGCLMIFGVVVSTHSRPKAAAYDGVNMDINIYVSTHSRPKAAAQYYLNIV